MHRRVLSFISVLFLLATLCFAQEDEGDWYYGHEISKIEFEGLNKVKKADLYGIINLFEDEQFTDDVYNELLDRLYALELFEDISPYAKHDPKNADKVLLVFKVIENPVVKTIEFEGNKKIRNSELREKVKIKKGDVFIDAKVLMAERNIRNFYIEKGYTNSSVSHVIEKTDDGVKIVFKINEGSNTVIKGIHFSGNTIVSEKILKSKLSLKEVGFLKDGAYQVATLEQDKIAVQNYYKERGYIDITILDVKVESELNEEKQRNELTITYYLQEGAQYMFTGMSVSGNEVFSKEQIMALNKMKQNAVYNETKFQETLSNIANLYYENGYMAADFKPIPLKDTERHEISYQISITENSRSHIENIIIKGNTKTKEYVIRREIPIEPGDVFSRDKIINGMRNLMNLQYFSNIVPEPQQGSEPGLIDLVWTVEEQNTAKLSAGVTFSGANAEELPILLNFGWTNSNMFGEGKMINSMVNLAPKEQKIDFSYGQSWIGHLPLAFNQTFSITRSTTYSRVNQFLPNMQFNQQYYFMNYTDYGFTLSSGISRRWTPNFAILTLGGGIQNTIRNNVFDESSNVPLDIYVSSYANRWGILNSIFTSFSVDHRDNNFDPTSGWFTSQSLGWSGLIPAIEKEFFLKTDTTIEGYLKLLDLPVSEKYNLKVILAGFSTFTGLFPAKNTTITESNRLYIDGMFNGRGWTDLYKYSKGEALFSNSVELRVPVVPNIIGIDAFWDAVAVKDKVSNMNTLKLDDFYFSFGPGIRMIIPQFPLRFLFAFRYRVIDNKVQWDANPFQFVLSFNIINR